MAISTLFKRTAPDNSPFYTATRLPSTSADLRASSFDNAMANNRFLSAKSMERQAQDELYEPLLKRAETEIPGFDRTSLRQKEKEYYFNSNALQFRALKKSEALGGRYAHTPEEARYAVLVDTFKELGWEVPDMEEVQGKAAANASEAARKLQEDLMFTISESPKTQMFFGEVGAVGADPVQIAMIAATTPVALSTRLLASAGIEAALNVAIDIPLLLTQQSWYEKQGRELTNEDVARQLLFSAALGTGFGATVSGAYRFAGGKNTAFLPSQPDMPWRYGLSDPTGRPPGMSDADIASNLERSRAMDDLKRQVTSSADATNGPYAYDSGIGISYAETNPQAANPFKQTDNFGVTSEAYKLLDGGAAPDTRIPDIATRNRVLGLIETSNFTNSSAYRFSPDTPFDQYTMSWRKAKTGAEHAENVKEAVLALHEGRLPTVPQKTALTVEITLGDSAARIGDLRGLVAGEVKLSMRSRPYREFLTNKISEIMTPRLREQVAALSEKFTPDRTPLKPEVSRPTRTFEQLDAAYGKLLDSEIALKVQRKALQEEKNAGHKFAHEYNRAAAAGEPLPKKPKGMRTLNAISADEVKLGRRTSANAKKEKEIAAGRKAWGDYDAELERVNVINDGMRAEKALAQLEKGELPTSLKSLRDQLDAHYQGLKDSPAVRGEAMSAGARERLEQLFPATRGTAFKPAKAYELDSVVRVLGDTEAEREVNAMYGELTRMDDNFEFSVLGDDGATYTTSVKKETRMLEELDNAVDATTVCAYGGGKSE